MTSATEFIASSRPVLDKAQVICITGGPRTGKTTLGDVLAKGLAMAHVDADQFLSLPSADQSLALAKLLMAPPCRLILSGTLVARGLRKVWQQTKGLQDPPCQAFFYLTEPFTHLSTPQAALARGIRTTLQPLAFWLRRCPVVWGPVSSGQ